jgi:hypothetical protein
MLEIGLVLRRLAYRARRMAWLKRPKCMTMMVARRPGVLFHADHSFVLRVTRDKGSI